MILTADNIQDKKERKRSRAHPGGLTDVFHKINQFHKIPLGEEDILSFASLPFLFHLFSVDKTNNGRQNRTDSSFSNENDKAQCSLREMKKDNKTSKKGHKGDIWSCIIPAYWKLGNSAIMRIFSGVFIFAVNSPTALIKNKHTEFICCGAGGV